VQTKRLTVLSVDEIDVPPTFAAPEVSLHDPQGRSFNVRAEIEIEHDKAFERPLRGVRLKLHLGVARGPYTLEIHYVTSLARSIRRQGDDLSLEWGSPRWPLGIDNERLVFSIPASNRTPTVWQRDDVTTSPLDASLLVVHTDGARQFIEIVRPHIARLDDSIWVLHCGSSAIEPPTSAPAQTAVIGAAPRTFGWRQGAWFLAVFALSLLAFSVVLLVRKSSLGAPLVAMPFAARATFFAISFALASMQSSLGPWSAGFGFAMVLATHRPAIDTESSQRWLKTLRPRTRHFSSRFAFVAPLVVPILVRLVVGIGVTEGVTLGVACLAWLPLFFWSSPLRVLQSVRARLGRKFETAWLGQHDSTAVRLRVIEPTGTIDLSVEPSRAIVRVRAPAAVMTVVARGVRLAGLRSVQRDSELEIETSVRFCADWAKWCAREMRVATKSQAQ
jgi:hypothetical protein